MSDKPSPTFREIKVDDEFSRQARLPGGLARETALKRAAAELEQIKPRLADYVRAEAKRLEAALLGARARDANFAANIRDAYTASRNIRDIAESIGYSLAGFITTNLCILIETTDAASGTYPADVIECHYAAFRLATSPAYLKRNPKEVPELLGGLLQIVEIATSATTRPASSADPAGDRS